ncbi:uncharacterized protein DNG_05129 [Cephalotrichum gorgonifer]|uniref:Uncharacterized protein n=1 Tax=Cephalotrichum gorgonifer TaxID=2041049 RepID=A0AAE8MXD1_9PEZI|nr:uncharacterized protein DNG_05129 [Cephalotrichum gorgonifer]
MEGGGIFGPAQNGPWNQLDGAIVDYLTMDRNESICDWPSDDGCDPGSPDLSSSEDEESQLATLASRSRLRPAGSALAFVPYANWDPERSYDTELTIRWNIE